QALQPEDGGGRHRDHPRVAQAAGDGLRHRAGLPVRQADAARPAARSDAQAAGGGAVTAAGRAAAQRFRSEIQPLVWRFRSSPFLCGISGRELLSLCHTNKCNTFLVSLIESEVSHELARQECANFGFGTLAGFTYGW